MDVLFFTRLVGLLVWALILSAGRLAARAWVATLLWSWFVASVFDLPELSVLVAAGLLFSSQLFLSFRNKTSDPKPHEPWAVMIAQFMGKFQRDWLNETLDDLLGLATVLGVGWGIYLLLG